MDPIPTLYEPVNGIAAFQRDPARYFPDDRGSRWMLGALSASQDIGLTMKTAATYLTAEAAEDPLHRQYRFSHMSYFWRLWLSHVHEAWVAFNQGNDDPFIRALKATANVSATHRTVSELRGRRIVEGFTAAEFIAKVRHVTFHYVEWDGDRWADQLAAIANPFPLYITDGNGRNADTRWLIADEHVLSRLNPFKYGDGAVQAAASELAHATMALVRAAQVEYFLLRDPALR